MEASTLNAYIHLLKDQVKELEAELEMLFLNPTFSAVVTYRYQSIQKAFQLIEHEGNRYKWLIKKMQTDIHQLEHGTKTYAPVMQIIRDYYTEFGSNFIDEEMKDS
jgi:prefoldin subunit 5